MTINANITNGLNRANQIIATAASNIANEKTNGFKAQFLLFKENGKPDITQNINDGLREKVNDPLSLAIEGRGMFCLKKNNKNFYKRSVHLSFDEKFILQCNGHNILNTQDKPIHIPQNTHFTISKSGEIYIHKQNTKEFLAKIKIVDAQGSFKEENGFMHDVQNTIGIDSPIIHSGYAEKSNINTNFELNQLIYAQQMYTLNAKALNVVNTLSKVDKAIMET